MMKFSTLLKAVTILFSCAFLIKAHALGPMCRNLSSIAKLEKRWKKIEISIKGTDDRKAEEEFGHLENREAQQILGVREIERSMAGVVGIECLYTKSNGKTYRNRFNGILVCDKQTLLVNGHSLKSPLCENTNGNFDCKINSGRHHPEERIVKPELSRLMDKDLCDNNSTNGSIDLAVLKLEKPSSRPPIKIGTVNSFEQIRGRRFVSVAANTSRNFVDSQGNKINTDKTFTISQFDELEAPSMAKSDTDGGKGSSGEAHLISQDGEPLVIGLRQGSYGTLGQDGIIVDRLPYDKNYHFSRSLFFSPEIQKFIRQHVKEPNKCMKEVAPENERSA